MAKIHFSDKTIELINKFENDFGIKFPKNDFYNAIDNVNDNLEEYNEIVPGNYISTEEGLVQVDEKTAKEYRKDKKQELHSEYKQNYRDILKKTLENYSKTTANSEFNENKNVRNVADGFEEISNYVLNNDIKGLNQLYKDKQIPEHGFMGPKGFAEFAECINFQQEKDVILNSFKGQSVNEIADRVNADYISDKEDKHTYEEYIHMAQALKEKHAKRGFFSRLFHPFDSAKEVKLYKDIIKTISEKYPGFANGVENDLNRRYYSKKGWSEYSAVHDISIAIYDSTLEEGVDESLETKESFVIDEVKDKDLLNTFNSQVEKYNSIGKEKSNDNELIK